jgi:hypothetical protein
MAVTINGTTGLTFNDASVQGAAGIGFGQTWQTVTRTSGVTYTNSTGKPIFVYSAASGISSSNSNTTISVSGGTAILIAFGNNTVGFMGAYGGFLVPNGATYVLTDTNISSVTRWELR